MYKHTAWQFGKIEKPVYVQPTTGNRFLKIIEAEYDTSNEETGPVYMVKVQDLQGGAIIENRYFQMSKNKNTGHKFVSKYFKETMALLGQALAGPTFVDIDDDEFNLLNPKDIIGGVVIGTVESREFTKRDGTAGIAYSVKKYYPAPQDWVDEFSDIAQYYEGCEDEEVLEVEDEEEAETPGAEEDTEVEEDE